MTLRLMDDLISSQVTLLIQRSRSMMIGSDGSNKTKYMTEEEELLGKMVVCAQEEEKHMLGF